MSKKLLPPIEELRSWPLEQMTQWLDIIGLDDCIPCFLQRNITGLHFANLTEEDLFEWIEIPIVRRRQLAQYLEQSRKTNSGKDKLIKGLFETISRRRKSAPPPLPADYKAPSSVISPPSVICTAIVVDTQKQIRPGKSRTDTNDWGSEFSDSESEDVSSTSAADLSSNQDVSVHDPLNASTKPVSNWFEPGSSSPHASYEAYNENLYELPEHDEGNHIVNGNKPNPPPVSHYQRSNSLGGVAAVHTRRKSIVQAKEVSQRLNILLASRISVNHSAPSGELIATPYGGPAPPYQRSISLNPENHIDDTYTDTRNRPKLPPKPVIQTSVPLVDPLDPYPWYHGKIDRSETCKRLEISTTDGAFLVRRSNRGVEKYASPYSLSLLFSGKVYHLTIRQRADKQFALGFEKKGEQAFWSVLEMIQHHYRQPIYLAECDQGVCLIAP